MRINRVLLITFVMFSLVAVGCGRVSSVVQEKSISDLPTWVMDLGVTLPQNMQLITPLCKKTEVADAGYDSLSLTYSGSYDVAMQEAARIASGAHLTASQELIGAQKLIKEGTQFSGIDTAFLSRGIVYTNYSLTATNIDYLVVVSVDGNGALTIEVTNYLQMNKRR